MFKIIYDIFCEFLVLGVYLFVLIICFIIFEEIFLFLNLCIFFLDLIVISNLFEFSFGLFVSFIGGLLNFVKVIVFVGYIVV